MPTARRRPRPRSRSSSAWSWSASASARRSSPRCRASSSGVVAQWRTDGGLGADRCSDGLSSRCWQSALKAGFSLPQSGCANRQRVWRVTGAAIWPAKCEAHPSSTGLFAGRPFHAHVRFRCVTARPDRSLHVTAFAKGSAARCSPPDRAARQQTPLWGDFDWHMPNPHRTKTGGRGSVR